MKEKKYINWRSFTSLYIAISFVIMVITGIILFLAPPGRIAHWSYWSILGLTKTEWQNIHIIFTFLFIIAGSFHIYYNWKPLIHYLQNKKQNTSRIKRELILALFSSILIFILTLTNIPPLGTIIDFGEYLTESWENKNNTPPIPHAERLTLAEFSETVNISFNRINKKLTDANIVFSDDLTLEQIAEKNNTTPNSIYSIINAIDSSKIPMMRTGSGYGRKTIEEICSDLNINVQEGLLKLEKKNIYADRTARLKDLANEYNMLPIDIYNFITSK